MIEAIIVTVQRNSNFGYYAACVALCDDIAFFAYSHDQAVDLGGFCDHAKKILSEHGSATAGVSCFALINLLSVFVVWHFILITPYISILLLFLLQYLSFCIQIS